MPVALAIGDQIMISKRVFLSVMMAIGYSVLSLVAVTSFLGHALGAAQRFRQRND